jgi:hypothetical protein
MAFIAPYPVKSREMSTQEVSPEVRQHDESVIRRELGHDGEIVFTDEGWDSRAYILNHGEAVFKFPRTPETAEQYRYEIAALNVLEGLNSPVRTQLSAGKTRILLTSVTRASLVNHCRHTLLASTR